MTKRHFTAAPALLAAALMLSACGQAEEAAPERSLTTVSPDRGEIRRVVGATGKIAARDEVTVGSEVSGKVLEVMVDFNDPVRVNDVLAIIDPTTSQNRLNQVQSQIENARAQIAVQEATIERARVQLDNAQRQMTRQQGLFDQDAISEVQLESAQRDMGLAKADMTLNEARLEASRASERQLLAQLSEARADLARTTIRSPIDGVIIDRQIDPGQTVQASFNAPVLFTIAADLSQISVDASVVESDVAGLEAGDTARFTVDAYPDDPVEGVVRQLRLKPTEQNNIVSYIAVIEAENPNGMLIPGMTANLQITTETKTGVLRLPVAAERFRPSPEDIEAFRADGEAEEDAGLLEPTYDRLRSIGLSEARIAQFRTQAEAATERVRAVLDDPSQPWMHARMRTQLAELMDNQVKTFLSADERQDYAALVASERTIRPVDLWVETGGKMSERTVRLGLSDGSFIEVVDGLTEGDRVVTGISAGGGASPGGRPGGRPGAAR